MNSFNNYYKGSENYNDRVVLLRTNLQKNIIKRFIKDKKNKILDIGSYGGLLLEHLYDLGYRNLYACDVFNSRETIKIPVKFSIEDITKKTNYKAGSFDLVIASHVMEHLYDTEAALKEIIRIIRNRRYLMLSIPVDVNISSRIKILLTGRIGNPLQAGGHIKFFLPGDIESLLKNENIKIAYKTYTGLGYGRMDYGRFGGITKFLANKLPKLFAGEEHILLQKYEDKN